MKDSARNLSVSALLEVKRNEGYSNIVIDKALRNTELEQRDKALASTIFYGVLEKRITLDYYISHCLKDKSKKIDERAREILRVAVYQLFYLDKVPESAIVNEAVNSSKAFGIAQLSGFINAVLRNLIRQKGNIKLPTDNNVSSLSIRYSVPEKLIMLWISSYGLDNTIKILDSFSKRPEYFIRTNTLKIKPDELKAKLMEEEIDSELCEYPKETLKIRNIGSIKQSMAFINGLFHVQDLSAQLVCEALSPKSDETILDCCAAPGGKSFTIAETMKDKGKISSLDLYKGRVGLIKQGADRLGLTIIDAKKNDALKGFDSFGEFDKIICDVPCSGFGVIRRKPEIRYKKLSDIRGLPEIQYEILRKASETLKPKGVIVYSTCTLNPSENEDVVKRFERENKDFEPLEINLPNIFERVLEEPSNMLTMMPFSGASDGFFMAAYRRK